MPARCSDAENRLTAVQPVGTPASGDRKVEFAYDYRGRRIEKRVFVHDGVAWGASSTMRFVYHGWNLLTEYSVSGSTMTLQRKNTWGLDLGSVGVPAGNDHGGSGALDSAGGIGGLLATLDTQGTTTTTDDKKYVYFCCAHRSGSTSPRVLL